MPQMSKVKQEHYLIGSC